jgi:hypothetical protein
VFKNTVCILQGEQNQQDGLWDIRIPLPTKTPEPEQLQFQHQLNAIIHKDLANTQLAQYLHRCCGSPVTSTWTHAIHNRNFITWLGIETLSVDAHLPKSVASAQGHLDQEQTHRMPKPLQPVHKLSLLLPRTLPIIIQSIPAQSQVSPANHGVHPTRPPCGSLDGDAEFKIPCSG